MPGDRPDRFRKAASSGAGAVIADLEDSVGAAAKEQARDAVARWLAEKPSAPVWVRVNNCPELMADDMAMAARSQAAGVVIPKAAAEACDASGLPVHALIETAAGAAAMAEIAASPRVVRLALGEADLCSELGIIPSADARELWAIRSAAVVASAAAGLEPPVGPAPTALEDDEALERTSRQLRRQGFGGRSVIHPRQIAAVHAAFAPGEAEVGQARRVVAAFAAAGGVPTVVDGRFVDRAVVRLAQVTLDQARQ